MFENNGMLDNLKNNRVLGDIKSRFGLGNKNQQDDGYNDGYDNYADYDENYDEYADYADDYGEYGSDYHDSGYTSRSSRSSYRSGGYSREISSPKLVSYEDVRAHTQVPDSLKRDPLPPRHVTPSTNSGSIGSRMGREVYDSSTPFALTPEGSAAASAAAGVARRQRSESLNTLFNDTSSDSVNYASGANNAFGAHSGLGPSPLAEVGASAGGVSGVGTSSSAARSGYDPYEAYAGTSGARYSSSRTCTVLKPVSYGEVERVAKIVKAGDVAVLCLRNTPDDLSKRVLDFSFGVASALDAQVECVGDKVFALTRGVALSESERTNLRNQGVL